MKDPRTAKPGTTQRIIAGLCVNDNLTKRECYSLLRPRVLSGDMVFRANVGGRRVPKSESEQLDDLRHNIGRIYNYLGRSKGSKFEDEEIPQDDSQEEIPQDDSSEDEEQQDEQDEDEQDEPKDEGKPQAKGKRSLREEWKYFVRRLHEVRKFCIDRERTEHVDWISMRPMQAASRMIAAGIPADVCLLSLAMHWSPGTRQDAGIDSFDFNTEGAFTPHPGMLAVSQRVMREREIDPSGKHALFGYLLLLIECRVPVMLVGPPGTGKSHIAEQVAEFLGMDYGETPMSSGASRSDLLGRHTINAERPFVNGEFPKQFVGGGIHSFEELDRADPSVVIVLHNALARKVLYNSVSGETLIKSEDFCAVATVNTFGLGANRQTTTAERMDSATIDRFRMGRLFLPIDEGMEETTFTAEFEQALTS